MRYFIDVANEIKKAVKEIPGYGTRKQEFYEQLGKFIRLNRCYPPEATYPWNELGHIIREYCEHYDGQYVEWQMKAREIIKGERK